MMSWLSAVAVVAATAASASQASGISSSGSGEWYGHVGCFHDMGHDRVLGDVLRDADSMTTEVCFDYCTELGAAFMATQWAEECWCSPDGGLDYNRHNGTIGVNAECDMPCTGDGTEMCGGYWTFDLYELSQPELLGEVMTDILDLHNEARCIHHANPMAWDSDVAASAQAHANTLSDTCNELFHSDSDDRNGYGENVYWCWGAGCLSAENAMSLLYDDEIQTDSVDGYGGHATQILWKSSTQLGCAVSSCFSGEMPGDYLVCQYDPPGNIIGQTAEEVDLPTNTDNC
eukprot:g12090.t1